LEHLIKVYEKAAYLNSSVIPSGICETQKFSIEKSSFGFLAVFPKKLLWPGFLTDVVGEQNVRKVN